MPKMAVLIQNKAKICDKFDHNIGFRSKQTPIFLETMAENRPK
jgi:hypothetical protein